MRSLPASTVFTRADARACGWTDSAISRALRSGRLIRLRHGQLSVRTEIGPRALAIAAAQACGGSAVSHRSALLLRDLPMVGHWPAHPELTVPPRRIGSLVDAHLYRATLWPQDVDVLDGVPVTSVARTVVDVARARPVATAVAAIDAALCRRLVTVEEIEDVLVRCWNWPGIRRAQRALSLSDGRAESPLESVSRLVIAWLHLPRPALQPVVLDERGYAVGRLDFYWDEYGVGGEADGRLKYDTRAVLTDEKDRQERIEDLSVVMTRWGWDLATRRPHALRAKIEAAFERGRLRDRSGFRRNWSVRPT